MYFVSNQNNSNSASASLSVSDLGTSIGGRLLASKAWLSLTSLLTSIKTSDISVRVYMQLCLIYTYLNLLIELSKCFPTYNPEEVQRWIILNLRNYPRVTISLILNLQHKIQCLTTSTHSGYLRTCFCLQCMELESRSPDDSLHHLKRFLSLPFLAGPLRFMPVPISHRSPECNNYLPHPMSVVGG